MTSGPVFFAFFFFLIIGTMMLGGVSAASWVPTKKDQRERLLEHVSIKSGAKVYDLGCGNGAVLFAMADRYPGIRAVGYEIAVLPLAFGLARKFASGSAYRGVSLCWRDFFGRDLSDADAVFVFLLPRSHARVASKLARELRDDAVVIVEAWPLPGAVLERTIQGDERLLPMYVYSGAGLRAAADQPRDDLPAASSPPASAPAEPSRFFMP